MRNSKDILQFKFEKQRVERLAVARGEVFDGRLSLEEWNMAMKGYVREIADLPHDFDFHKDALQDILFDFAYMVLLREIERYDLSNSNQNIDEFTRTWGKAI